MANRLGELGSQMPVADQEAAQRAEAARLIGLQNQLGQVTAEQAAMAGPGLGQQVGAEQTLASGAETLGVAQGQATQVVQQGEQALRQAEIDEAERRIGEKERAQNLRIDQEARLNSLGRDIKEKIFDARLRFDTREGEAKFANQAQLMDYKIANAKSSEEFNDYASTVEIALNKDMQMMREAYAQFEQKERQMLASGEAELNRESLVRIREKKRLIAEAQERARKRASKSKKMFGAAKMVVGAGITAVGAWFAPVTGGASLAAGGAVGGGLIASGGEEYANN